MTEENINNHSNDDRCLDAVATTKAIYEQLTQEKFDDLTGTHQAILDVLFSCGFKAGLLQAKSDDQVFIQINDKKIEIKGV